MREAFEAALKEDWNDILNHRAYADWLDENDEIELANLHREWTPDKQQKAEKWLRNYAEKVSDAEYDDDRDFKLTYIKLIEAGNEYLVTGNSLCLPFNTPDFVYDSAKAFWKNFQTVTCRIVPKDKQEDDFIRCAC